MYNFALHHELGERTSTSARRIVALLRSFLPLDTVLDVGCGDGRFLALLQQHGSDVFGIDGAWTDQDQLLIPRSQFKVMDLARPFDLGRRFDLAICLEVAEHLPRTSAGSLVSSLIHHADIVLFSAAIPAQGGDRHVNEQWQSTWVAQFAQLGYAAHDVVRSQVWDDAEVYHWYKQNVFLYVNTSRPDLLARVQAHIRQHNIVALPVDIVHPDCYRRIAPYDALFRPLKRVLPTQTLNMLRNIRRSYLVR